MSQFNSFEKTAAYLLSFTPGLKKYLKRGYQFLNYLFYRKAYRYHCIYPVQAIFEQPEESFFGYYDKSPENADGGFTLFHTTMLSTSKKPSARVPASITLKDNLSHEVFHIETSYAYNWQQGTKLQWLTNRNFIFNIFDRESQSYRAVIYDTDGILVSKLQFPIYDCFSDKYALSLTFERLNALRRDYGYRCHDMSYDLSDAQQSDGIFFCDIKSNKSHLLLSLEDLSKLKPLPSMKRAHHKVNHIMISPNGERFMFIHRWITQNGKRYDRLVVANKDGGKLKVVADDEMVCHCCWYDDETIIGYMRHPSFGDGFYRIDLKDCDVSLLSEKLCHLSDGHPSFYGKRMIFDSYPDRSRMKHLYLYDIEKDTLNELGEFYESLKYFEETRCDLHPRWSEGGRSVFIDSVHEGKRKLYKIQLEQTS